VVHDPRVRHRVALYGVVQGVGFRYFVRQHARSLDLAGYVLNRTDGAVELEATGEATAMAGFLHTVAHGPPDARVERVETLELSSETLPQPFAIRR
jgi:acylphosphatase